MASVNKLEFYLQVLKPVTVLTAQVNGSPSDPYMTVTFDGGQTGSATSVGTSGAPVAGNTAWFGTSAGGQDLGTIRLRYWSPSNGSGTAGSISVAENDDVTPWITDNDHITVKLEWRLWGIAPRLVQSGTNVSYWEDYDIGFNDQTVNWRPIAVAGPPALEFGRGPVTASFVGDRSFALAPGAILTTYAWTAHGSVEGTSASQGTEASPVVFTWTSPGQYLVTLQVTDSNGRNHTAYTWAYIIDPSDPDAGAGAYTQFDAYNDSTDFFRGGGESSFTVHGVADVTEFPREAMIIHAARGTQTTPTGSWPFRTNNLFTGYITAGTIRQDSVNNTTSFRAQTIDGLMKNLSMHAVSLRDSEGPKNWTMAKDITVDRAGSFVAKWRSTLADMTPIRPMEYTAEIFRQDFAPSTIYAQLQNELVKDAWGQVVSDHQSVLHWTRDYNLMTLGERASGTTRKTLTKGDWLDSLDIEERPDYAWPVRKVKMSGIYYPGNQAEAIPYFSEAPGDVHKAFGREDAPGRLILSGQADLNTRCGYALARQNMRWHTLRGRFVNDGSFTVAPQEIFPAIIEPTDNNRGLSWTPDLIPRRVRRTYDHANGTFISEVEFEPSATGPSGMTVELPSGKKPPRTPTIPTWDPPPIPPYTPPIEPQPGAAVASDGAMGVYWTLNKGATWERRINGLATGATGTSQLFFRDLIWDPHWFTPEKQATSDPEQAILWGCGAGFVVRSADAAKNWEDMTTYLDDPPNSYNFNTPPVVGLCVFRQIHADIHTINRFYMLVECMDDDGTWGSWIARTDDDGVTWTYYPLGLIVDDDGFIYPIETGNYLGRANQSGVWYSWAVSSGSASDMVGEADEEKVTYELVAVDNSATTFRLCLLFDMGTIVSGTRSYEIKSQELGTLDDKNASLLGTNNRALYESTIQDGKPDGWVIGGLDVDWLDVGSTDEWHLLSTRTEAQFAALRYYMLNTEIPNNAAAKVGSEYLVDSFRISGTFTPPEYRALAIDLDTEDASRLYMTVFDITNSQIALWVYDTASMTQQWAHVLGAATDAEITTKSTFAVPHTPHYPGTASFGDYVYVFGRWNETATGTVQHLHLSTDGADNFSDIGDATWSTERVGAFRPTEDTAGTELYAFLNGTPAQWRTQDSGASWSSLGSNPFDVEFEAMSRHWGGSGDFLIGANAAGSVQAAWLDSPYTDAWYDATGPAGQRLPTAADGGSGITAIIWI